MALRVSCIGRHRSISRALDVDEQATETVGLIRELGGSDGSLTNEELERLSTVMVKLGQNLRGDGRAKDIFRHGSGFQRILGLLDRARQQASFDPGRMVALVANVTQVLGESLRDHRGNEKYFVRCVNGWDALRRGAEGLQEALISNGGMDKDRSAVRKLQWTLFSLALDGGEEEAAPGCSWIRYPQAASAAMALAVNLINDRASSSDKESNLLCAIETFERVRRIAEQSTHNAFGLWQAGVLSQAIHLAIDGCLHDDDPVKNAALSLTLSLADFGINEMASVTTLFKRACESDSARSILANILECSKGPAFIQFDLAKSGYSSIEFPCLPRSFPPPTGYTFSVWLRIDRFDSHCHTTLFGAFDSTQTCFVLVYLEQDSHQLILQTSVRSPRPSVRFRSTRFATGVWYHVALVHRKSAAEPRQSPAVLFINGEFAEQVKCGYPEPPPEYEDKHTKGSPARVEVRRTRSVQAFLGTPHDLAFSIGRNKVQTRWSFASAYLYATPLTDEFVAVQYRLGSRYNGNMQDCMGPFLTYRASAELKRYDELLHPEKSDQSDITTAIDHRASEVVPESRILLSISPWTVIDLDGITDGEATSPLELDRKAFGRYQQLAQKTRSVAVNGAVYVMNEAIFRSYGSGILTGDPTVALPKPLDDATWCVAGTLPLVIQLLESANSKAAFLQAVAIFLGCFKDNWRTSEAMEKGNGFGMFALIIREKLGLEIGFSASVSSRKPASMFNLEERQSLPSELLPLLLEFVGYDPSKPEDSIIVNAMAYRVFFMEFDTWRRCDIATQKLYYSQFVHFVSHNRHQKFNLKRFEKMRIVKRLIDVLKCEEVMPEVVDSILNAIRVLHDDNNANNIKHTFHQLANFVIFGLQDDRAMATRSIRSVASMVSFRQRAASWARGTRGSRPNTPGGPQQPPSPIGLSRAELAIHVLQLLTDIICDERSTTGVRRFYRIAPNRWLVHLLAEPDARVISMALRIVSRSLSVIGSDFKASFIAKNSGFVTLKARMKPFWRVPSVWLSCFAILFGQQTPDLAGDEEFNVFTLVKVFHDGDRIIIVNEEILPVLMNMLEAGLRAAVNDAGLPDADVGILNTVIQYFSELYSRYPTFRTFASDPDSSYMQSLLFVLYPVLVGSDRLSAEMERQAEKDSLSFKGQEVKLRPHSNSLGERPPSVRSVNLDEEGSKRTPSPLPGTMKAVGRPRRLSSFVMIRADTNPAQFSSTLAPKANEPVRINIANSLVESLLEVTINLIIDVICHKEKFKGIGLFLKCPPGFREHQAYFESYILVNTLAQLMNHLKLNQNLFLQASVLMNLCLFSTHVTEAVFEGWFINGAQPTLDFVGQVLEYLEQPSIAQNKTVRLCSQYTTAMRVLFLRVTLWRLSELDDEDVQGTVDFLNKMDYWQTILFSSENQETLFIRLICFQLYLKLVSTIEPIRYASARLWRTILVQKPTVSATLLTQAVGSEQRHLSTGFMRLMSIEDGEFIQWVDEHRDRLDPAIVKSLSKPWDDFVNEENKSNEVNANARLEKRRERLRIWQKEESEEDDKMHRFEVSTRNWRANIHSQERVKLQRAIQDHQENVNHLLSVFMKNDKLVKQPCGLEPPVGPTKWQLDETEAVNRMRIRLTPDESDKDVFQPKRKASERHPNGKLAVNTQIPRIMTNNISSAFPDTPTPVDMDGASEQTLGSRKRADSVSNSQLLEGGYDIVDDPNVNEEGTVDDKNRRIMTRLQRGDGVENLYNISRIVGLEACEGLLVIGKKCLYMQDDYFQRSDGEIVSASQAPDDERDPYVRLISGKDVGTARTKHSIGDQETRHWRWEELLSISKRRFLFRDVAVEVFFTDGRSYLLTCISQQKRDALYSEVVSRPHHMHNSSAVASEDSWRLDTLRNPEDVPQSLGTKFATVFSSAPTHAATKKWMKGEMSNFQYLMLINTMAGRTFNDLTQYPVFPWILADYTSEELDLSDPKTFRNLAKPMGCQTTTREAEFRERYKQFAEMGGDDAPPFHYGTHYSSAMIVSSYLIRLQPFVQSYLLLQGGQFDHADRLFDSIGKAWSSASRDNMSDVRELTPEFFCLPEFLININQYDFGVKQGRGGTVNDVELPPWAKGDPHIFIRKHREALESPYVSAHLHEWIDLIFGFKQRGEAAVDATNVFGHLSYQGSKDLDSIQDQVERLATIGIIHSFGQTPYQVFQRPHPAREIGNSSIARLDTLAESLIRLPDPLFQSDEKVAGLTFSPTLARLLCDAPCKLNLLPNCDRFLQWGFADHSLRFLSSNTNRLLGLHENTHIGPISTALFADSKTLVTAGVDCTIAIWVVNATRDLIELQPKTYLFGHRTSVTLLAASRVFSTLLSVSVDGQVILWGLNRFNCIRVLRSAGEKPIQAARLSNITGHIALCQGPRLLVYTLNGHLLVEQKICDSEDDEMNCCAFYEGAGNEWIERELIFTGHSHGSANVWALVTLSDGSWHLQLIKRLNHTDVKREDGGNTSAAITAILPMPTAVYTGDENGRVWEWDCIQKQSSLSLRGK
ncbi:hypothetical protein M433DRAFT_150591 [Acidomyces richmondensis BFW]|nr:MAG: hypothetical protein FE78DRAFT_83910 [Acidomyces sp. 'richmondensis']KYG48899.1 hypothetical protein M433DRAFT_150591 [Acidomyces richmondensis BFW]